MKPLRGYLKNAVYYTDLRHIVGTFIGIDPLAEELGRIPLRNGRMMRTSEIVKLRLDEPVPCVETLNSIYKIIGELEQKALLDDQTIIQKGG